MKNIIVYGSHLWKDCPPLKEYLSAKGVQYHYLDVSLDLPSLKSFLKLRDNNPIFNEVKAAGMLGLPTIVVGDEIIIDFQKDRLEEIL